MATDAGARFGDAEAVVDGGRRVTFAELVADFRRVTAALMASGIEPGERVAIWAPNRYEWLVAALGTLGAGAAVVPVNTRFKGNEVHHILDRSGARVVVHRGRVPRHGLRRDARRPSTSPPEPRVSSSVSTTYRASTTRSTRSCGWASRSTTPRSTRASAPCKPTTCATCCSRRERPGAPKGVPMTHAQTLRQFSDWCDMAGLVAGDRYLVVNPFFHMFGYKAGCLASLMQGATIIPKAVFDVDEVLRTVDAETVTVLPGPPTIYQSILDHPDRDRFDLSSLRVAVTGAADIPVDLIRRLNEELPFQTIITGYGLTEAGTVTGTGPDDDFATIATTVGRARPGLEIRIADDNGVAQPVGEPGEVLVRGYSVMRGYLDDPEETARAVDPEGWLHTGDLGTLDEQRMPPHRRTKEGHVHRRRLQRVPRRDREPAARPSGGQPGCGGGDAGRAAGRGRHGVRRAWPRARSCARRSSSSGRARRWPTTRCPGRSRSSTISR